MKATNKFKKKTAIMHEVILWFIDILMICVCFQNAEIFYGLEFISEFGFESYMRVHRILW